MSNLLDRAAVGCLKGKEAGEILEAYIETQPDMVFTNVPAAQQQPSGSGAGDSLVKPR
jgi:hypothetical protein